MFLSLFASLLTIGLTSCTLLTQDNCAIVLTKLLSFILITAELNHLDEWTISQPGFSNYPNTSYSLVGLYYQLGY